MVYWLNINCGIDLFFCEVDIGIVMNLFYDYVLYFLFDLLKGYKKGIN